VDYKLELLMIPVSDMDRAKDFYVQKAGFKLEVDGMVGEGRIVQVTPPGSACSVGFSSWTGEGDHPLGLAAPGLQQGLHLVVTDIGAARDELVSRGVDVSEIRHYDGRDWHPGRNPNRSSYMSFASFSDPDGNVWLLQEVRSDNRGTV
jgi:catechol 2,3-dioxygenase-like lactoylglutathione lyase family enzyme